MKIFKLSFLLAFFSLLLLGTLELGLRIAGAKFEASLYQDDSYLYSSYRPLAAGWTVTEGENYLSINSLGMRDRERSIQSPPEAFRIAFLGDSMVAALQVPLDQIMTQQLERGLNQVLPKAKGRIEVLNFASGGANLPLMQRTLDKRVWEFQPQIVVICLSNFTVPNSFRPTHSSPGLFLLLDHGRLIEDPLNDPPIVTPKSRYWHNLFSEIYNRSRLLQLGRTAQQAKWSEAFVWTKSGPKPLGSENSGPAEFMRTWSYHAPDTPELDSAWQITEAVLAEMILAARQHNTEVWLVHIGNEIEEDPRDDKVEQFLKANHLSDFRYASKRYAAFADREGVHYLYLPERLQPYARENQVFLHGFFNTQPNRGHWNEQGNTLAAKTIQESLLAESEALSSYKQ